MDVNKIINGDSLEYIKGLPDNSIDCILTDPPYEMKMGGGGCFKDRQYWKDIPNQYLNMGFDINILKEYKRLLKSMNLIVFCSKDQLLDYLLWCKENDYLWILITWNKTNPIPATNNIYLPDTEYIFHIREKNTGLNGNYFTKRRYYITQIEKNNYNHPTVKPLSIIKNLIINSTNEGDIILDPFAGSFTTCVAAKELNRKYIGIEINKEYFEIGRKRLENTQTITNRSLI